MPGNPYPNTGGGGDVEPGYDAHEWAPVSDHGRGMYPGSERVTMSYSPRGGQAPPLAPGRRQFERQHSPNRHSHRQHENMNPHPMEGRYRGVSFAGRPGGRPSFARSYSDDDEDDEDEGEWFDEENTDDEEERVFFPPKMGRGRGRGHAWDSSDGEEFERRFDDEDEEDFDEEDEEDEEFEEAFAQPRGHFRGGMMPGRGHPRLHRGAMRGSSPPPLETPPDSPPSLSFGTLPHNMDPRMMRGRDMDPRMMRGRDMDPRMMRGRDMDPRMMRGRDMGPRMMRGRGMSPSMMNRGGVRNIPVRGGPPFSRGNSMRQGPVSRKRARFVDSHSSTTSSDSRDVPRFQRPSGGFRPPSRSGGSIKRAMKWLTKPDGQYYTLLL